MLEEWNNGEMGFRENGYMEFWLNRPKPSDNSMS
jgi:hypothetical protein